MKSSHSLNLCVNKRTMLHQELGRLVGKSWWCPGLYHDMLHLCSPYVYSETSGPLFQLFYWLSINIFSEFKMNSLFMWHTALWFYPIQPFNVPTYITFAVAHLSSAQDSLGKVITCPHLTSEGEEGQSYYFWRRSTENFVKRCKDSHTSEKHMKNPRTSSKCQVVSLRFLFARANFNVAMGTEVN